MLCSMAPYKPELPSSWLSEVSIHSEMDSITNVQSWLMTPLPDRPSGGSVLSDCSDLQWSRDRCASISREDEAQGSGDLQRPLPSDATSPYSWSDTASQVSQTPSPFHSVTSPASLDDLDSVITTVNREANPSEMTYTVPLPVEAPQSYNTSPHCLPYQYNIPHNTGTTSMMAELNNPEIFNSQDLNLIADYVQTAYQQGTLDLPPLGVGMGSVEPRSPALLASLADEGSDDVFLSGPEIVPKIKLEMPDETPAIYSNIKVEPEDICRPKRAVLGELERRLRRRESNRRAARKCRTRKKQAQDSLVIDFKRLEKENQALRVEVDKLRLRNRNLEDVWNHHRECCVTPHLQA